MNEQIEEAMNKVLKTVEAWDEAKTYQTALQLQMQLSILKLLVGVDKFDELPAFARLLKEATDFIDAEDKIQKGACK